VGLIMMIDSLALLFFKNFFQVFIQRTYGRDHLREIKKEKASLRLRGAWCDVCLFLRVFLLPRASCIYLPCILMLVIIFGGWPVESERERERETALEVNANV